MDKTHSTKEELVSFNNLPTAINAAQQFASALNDTRCANDGLSVYVVSTKVQELESGTGWGITAGVVGGTAAIIGISTYAGWTAALFTAAGVTASAPVVGWIAAGVLAAAAGIFSVIPSEIEAINQVMVIDGPYLIK